MIHHGIYTYKFEYRLNGTSRWNVADTKRSSSTECRYTYVGLEEGKTYDLRLTVADVAGNTLVSEIKTKATVDSTKPEVPKVAFYGTKGIDGWYRSNLMINITPGKDIGSGIWGIGYKVYKKDTRTKTIPEPGGIVIQETGTESVIISRPNVETRTTHSIQITQDGTYRIEVYTIDKQGRISDTVKLDFKRDATLPECSTTVLYDDGMGAKTATVRVTGSDAMTGIASYYFDYKIKESNSWSTQHIENTSERSCQYEYYGLREGTEYQFRVRIADKAGNITNPDETKWLTQTTHNVNSIPTLSTYVKDKTPTSILIGARATDGNGDRLTYDLFFGETNIEDIIDGTPTATKTALAGQEVTFLIDGLEEWKDYAWSVQTSDGLRTIYLTSRKINPDDKESVPILGNTMCNGIGLWCCGPTNIRVTCSKCQGEHYIHNNGDRYAPLVPCDSCGGAGEYLVDRPCTQHTAAQHSKLEAAHYQWEKCGACDGKGELLGVPPTGYKEKYCTACHGKGSVIVFKSCGHGLSDTHICCEHEEITSHGNKAKNETEYNKTKRTCNGPFKKTVVCETCKGIGYKLDGNKEITCEVCKGKRQETIESGCEHGYFTSHTYIQNDSINEVRYYVNKICTEGIKDWCCGPANRYETCRTCSGTGYRVSTVEKVENFETKTITKYSPCATCSGSGKVSVANQVCDKEHEHVSSSDWSRYELERINCKICNGAGKLSLSEWRLRYPGLDPEDYEEYYCFDCNGIGARYMTVLKPCKHGVLGQHGCCKHGLIHGHSTSTASIR